MGGFFDVNNSVWSFVGKLFDAFVLHFLWLVLCVPVVTIGPATAALYFALIRDVRNEEGHYVRAFFRSFKENLKQGMLIGIPDTLLFVLLLYLGRFYLLVDGTAVGNSSANYLILLAVIPYLFYNQYLFAYLGIFSDSIGNLLKGAFMVMSGNPGKTLLMTLISIAFYVLVVYFELWPALLFGYGLVAYINSWFLGAAFDPLIRRIRAKEDELREKKRAEEGGTQ